MHCLQFDLTFSTVNVIALTFEEQIMNNPKKLHNEQPCERCGSPKIVSKTWTEEIQNSLSKSTVEVSQTICSNQKCQAEFDLNREKELAIINSRKQAREEQEKIRKENIAKTVAKRKESKAAA